MGVTPGMVSLAKKFKDSPFHLIASHCQNGNKDNVLNYLRTKGWDDDMENFTVADHTNYPGMVGNHVPYYFIFDHTGKLRYHHMCGAFHGGDGDKYQSLVEELIKETPAIFIDLDKIKRSLSMAKDIQFKKNLPKHLKAIEKALANEDDRELAAEHTLMLDAVKTYKDNRLQVIDGWAASEPVKVISALQGLLKEVKGSSLEESVKKNLSIYKKSKDHKAAIQAYKNFTTVKAAVSKDEKSGKLAATKAKHMKNLDMILKNIGHLAIAELIRTYKINLESR